MSQRPLTEMPVSDRTARLIQAQVEMAYSPAVMLGSFVFALILSAIFTVVFGLTAWSLIKDAYYYGRTEYYLYAAVFGAVLVIPYIVTFYRWRMYQISKQP